MSNWKGTPPLRLPAAISTTSDISSVFGDDTDSFVLDHLEPEQSSSFQEAIERAWKNATDSNITKVVPESAGFVRVQKSLYYRTHEGDGETWGYYTNHYVFTLGVSNNQLLADGDSLGRLDNYRNARDVQKRLDSYIAYRVRTGNSVPRE